MRIPSFLGAAAVLAVLLPSTTAQAAPVALPSPAPAAVAVVGRALPAAGATWTPSTGGARRATTRVVGASGSAGAKTKAYGAYCKSLSAKRVKGVKGTPFALCTTAMAKLATERTASPRVACKGLATKRARGTKRAPFAACVTAGAKLLKDKEAAEEAAADDAENAENAENDNAYDDNASNEDDDNAYDDNATNANANLVEDDGGDDL